MGVRFRLAAASAVAVIAVVQAALSPARAQSQSETVVLPQVSVSATGIATPLDQIGSSVTVFTAADIERTQRRTVPDLLNMVPGVQVVQNGSPGTQTSVFMRGSNSNHVKVLIDGVDVGDPSNPNGAVDFGFLTTADIERIEVLRGPQSGLYGSNAIGGVISITTKKGSGPAKATGYLEAGSFKTFNQAVGVSGSHQRFNYSFNASHVHAGATPVTPGYMVPTGGSAMDNYYDNQTYSSRLGYDLTDQVSINAYGRYTDAYLRYTNDDPAPFPGKTYGSQSTARSKIFSGRIESVVKLFDDRFVNTFGANIANTDRTNQDPGLAQSDFEGRRNQVDWRGKLTLMPGHILLAGIERQNERATTSTVNASTGNTGGFVEMQSEFFNSFYLVANVRRDSHDAFGDHTTWRVAPTYIVPWTRTKLKASYGTGFKAPSLYQLYGTGSFGFTGNPNLQPETSRGYEWGFEQPLPDDRFRVGLTFWHNTIDNLIDYNNTYTSLINVSKAYTYGFEAFGSFIISNTLSGRIDFTQTTAKNAVTSVDLLRRPRNKVTVSATWQATDRLTVTPTIIYIDKWRDVDRSTFAQRMAGPAMTANIAIDYKVDEKVTAFARADNIFNRVYENPLGWEQPGLAVYAGVRMATR